MTYFTNYTVKCNNCDFRYEEDADHQIFECPNCQTSDYLMDMETK